MSRALLPLSLQHFFLLKQHIANGLSKHVLQATQDCSFLFLLSLVFLMVEGPSIFLLILAWRRLAYILSWWPWSFFTLADISAVTPCIHCPSASFSSSSSISSSTSLSFPYSLSGPSVYQALNLSRQLPLGLRRMETVYFQSNRIARTASLSIDRPVQKVT